jgi:hypothetical protein
MPAKRGDDLGRGYCGGRAGRTGSGSDRIERPTQLVE